MIDFRYHLVSLVSVFLALAVGIVLGAGPLKGELGATLNRDVQNLRSQLSEKDAQVRTQSLALDNRDAFTRALVPGLAAGRLPGQRVVLVALPGVDSDTIAPLTETLEDAGASVAGRVDVRSAWIDPAREADRQALAGTLTVPDSPPGPSAPATGSASTAPGGTAASGPAGPTSRPAVAVARMAAPSPAPEVDGATAISTALARLLAAALLTTDSARVGQADKGASDLLDALRKAGLVAVEGDLRGRSDQAVLLVPAVQPAAGGATSPSAAADPAAQWSALAVALDGAGQGAVVTGPASSGTSGGVVAEIRGQEAVARAVSTVDTGGTPMGDLTTVLALHEQLLGGTGRYGFVGPVDGPVPSSSPAARS